MTELEKSALKYIDKKWTEAEKQQFIENVENQLEHLIECGYIDANTGEVKEDFLIFDIGKAFALFSSEYEKVFDGSFLDELKTAEGVTYRQKLFRN